MATLDTSSQLGSGTGTNNLYVGPNGATKVWAGGTATIGSTESFEVAAGVTITGNNENIIASALGGTGTLDVADEVTISYSTEGNNTHPLNISVPTCNIHYGSTTYKAFGNWNITNGAAGSTVTTDARPTYTFGEFNGRGVISGDAIGLSFFNATLNPASSLGTVNFWNGELGANALGSHFQAATLIPIDEAVLAPAGANLDNQDATNYRNFLRVSGGGNRNADNEDATASNHVGPKANIDFRGLGSVVGTATQAWVLTLDAGANANFINPLIGRPQNFNVYGVGSQFGSSVTDQGTSRARFFMASNPQTTATGDHRYTFTQANMTRGIYTPATAVWNQDQTDAAFVASFAANASVDNPTQGIFIRTQQIEKTRTATAKIPFADLQASVTAIEAYPTDFTYRKYSLAEQVSNDEFGKMYTVQCPTINAPDTIAEENTGDVSVQRARESGFNIYYPTVGWQDSFDVSSTADAAFLLSIPAGTFEAADDKLGIESVITANQTRTVSDVLASMKAYAYNVAETPNAANDKIDLAYTRNGDVLDLGSSNLVLSTTALTVGYTESTDTWTLPIGQVNSDAELNTILTTGTITGSRQGSARLIDQNVPGPGDLVLTLPNRADTYYAVWNGTTIANEGLCNGQTVTTTVTPGNDISYAIVSRDLNDVYETVTTSTTDPIMMSPSIGTVNPFFDAAVVFDESDNAYSYITPYDGTPGVSPTVAVDPNDGTKLSVEFYSVSNTAERRINVARWSNIVLSIKSGTDFGTRYAKLLARHGGTPIVVSGTNPGELSTLIDVAYTNPTQIQTGAAIINGIQGGLDVTVSALPTSFSEGINYDIVEGRTVSALREHNVPSVSDVRRAVEPLY